MNYVSLHAVSAARFFRFYYDPVGSNMPIWLTVFDCKASQVEVKLDLNLNLNLISSISS